MLNKNYHKGYQEGKTDYEFQKSLGDVPGMQSVSARIFNFASTIEKS